MSKTESTSLSDYRRMAERCTAAVMSTYSTSFSLATNLLPKDMRTDIRNLYAMVRIADEIVDGVAAEAGLSTTDIADQLDAYEQAVSLACRTGFATDPVLFAFADTYRACNIEQEHVDAFFHSMRADVTEKTYESDELDDYIYGSAEVIGLMCVSIFLRGSRPDPAKKETLVTGARHLGAAFQKINFLRDLHQDSQELGRTYFAGSEEILTDAHKDELVADIRRDLEFAYAAIPSLPRRAQAAVLCAYYLFAELTDKVDELPAATIMQQRVRVTDRRKLRLAAKAMAETYRR